MTRNEDDERVATITIGVNDEGFSDLLQMLMEDGIGEQELFVRALTLYKLARAQDGYMVTVPCYWRADT